VRLSRGRISRSPAIPTRTRCNTTRRSEGGSTDLRPVVPPRCIALHEGEQASSHHDPSALGISARGSDVYRIQETARPRRCRAGPCVRHYARERATSARCVHAPSSFPRSLLEAYVSSVNHSLSSIVSATAPTTHAVAKHAFSIGAEVAANGPAMCTTHAMSFKASDSCLGLVSPTAPVGNLSRSPNPASAAIPLVNPE
jgi:hypothetical protein